MSTFIFRFGFLSDGEASLVLSSVEKTHLIAASRTNVPPVSTQPSDVTQTEETHVNASLRNVLSRHELNEIFDAARVYRAFHVGHHYEFHSLLFLISSFLFLQATGCVNI